MNFLSVSIPLITTGLLLPMVLFYGYIYRKFPTRLYLSVLLLTVTGFLYILFDYLSVYSGSIAESYARLLQYNRIKQLTASLFIPLLPFFISNILEMTPVLRKVTRYLQYAGLAFFSIILLTAFLFPESFVSVSSGFFAPGSGRLLEENTGFLFTARDIYLFLVLLYAIVLIIFEIIRFRELNYLFQLLIGSIIAMFFGVSALLESIFETYTDFLSTMPFSKVGASIVVFTLFGLTTYLRYFLNEVKIVQQTKKTLENKEQELQYLAFYDELTSLKNRKSFFINLGNKRPTAADSDRQRVICLIDLDNFGSIVDAYGQEISDYLLTLVAQRLEEHFSEIGALFRIGGDEFALTSDDYIKRENIRRIGDEILECFREPFEVGVDTLFVSPSIGIALSPENGEAPEELNKNAMRALARAKVDRNTYSIYSPEMTLHASERLALIHGLRESIASSSFMMYYQPIIDKHGNISGAEALIRWSHPDHQDVSPAVFIPLAEISGLILPLSDWIVHQVARDMDRLQESGLEANISMNLSIKQFKQPRLCENLIEILRPHEVNHNNISLEVTESSLAHNFKQIKRTLECFQSNGFSISIDDFGTGYSSLSYLHELPFDKLKIDKSFVRKLDDDTSTQALVSSIIDLGNKMGYKMVAEGVETKKELEILKSNDCDYYQGFLFSHPLSFEDFSDLLKNRPHHPLFAS